MKLMMTEIKEGIFKANGLESEKDRIDYLVSLRESASELWNAYKKLPCSDVVDLYQNKQLQEVYMLRYLPFYSLLQSKLLKLTQSKIIKLPIQELDVLVIGGGPGTEILGISHYLSAKNSQSNKMPIRILDSQSDTWSHSRNIIVNHVIPNLNVGEFAVQSQNINITESLTNDDMNWISQPNLIILQNILNEIESDKEAQVKNNVFELIRRLPVGGLILFIDKSDRFVNTRLNDIKSIASLHAGLKTNANNLNQQDWFIRQTYNNFGNFKSFTSDVDNEVAEHLFMVNGSNIRNRNPYFRREGLILSLELQYKFLVILKTKV